ncbi:MAG TPA: dephospho-CoA kinase [Bdellovibrionales bacterium]|nr:dephospho-CoA kinase [Bdellovibrionales bacterium]
MIWIGLTGGIATGKSTVSRVLIERGYAVVDADLLAREAVQVGSDAQLEVARVFGPDAVLANGELNRKKIGEIVFSDQTKLKILENIIHPKVRALALARKQELQDKGFKLAFYDVPLLFEKGMKDFFDRVLVVACDPKIQRERLINRDGMTGDEADRRIASQIPIDEKVKLADDVILNNGTRDELVRAVDTYLSRF